MAGLPQALRVGTSALERDDLPFQDSSGTGRQPSTQYNTPSDRSSTHHSSRASLVSIGSIRTTRSRYSIAETDDHKYSHQSDSLHPLPALPTFASPINYEPFTNPFEPQGGQYIKPARKPSLLSKLGSFSSRRNGSRYGALADEEQNGIGNARHKRLSGLEENHGDSIGIDLSSFESPITIHGFGQSSSRNLGQEEREYNVLGGGMNTFVSADLGMSGYSNHRQGKSFMDAGVQVKTQRETGKQGEIIAIVEIPEYDPRIDDDTGSIADISSISGGVAIQRNTRGSFLDGEGGPKKSFAFPVDPEQPAWRPVVMRRPWMTLLVFIAFVLAALQEFLCQLSTKRQKEKTPRGILTFKTARDLSLWEYFAWKYMPTFFLLSYGVMWQVVDFEVKRLEPYYQLSKRTGATARDSLNQDYLTFLAYLVPLKAIRAKQWAVVFSSIATLLAGSVVPVLQSASIVMLPEKKERKDGEDKYVCINPIWSRVMSGVLLCVALYGILLLHQLRRKSGLLSDPKGIAGIAAMATKSHILNDFKGLDVAPNNRIHDQLRTRRYNLHKSSLWQGEFIKNEEKVQNVKEDHPHPYLLRLQAGIPFIGYIIAVGAAIPCFVFIGEAVMITERVPFLLTALATGIKLGWGALDMNLRVIEPYYVLSRRNAPPRTLVMDYTGTVPGYFSFLAWKNGQFLLGFVGLGSVLSEVLTVCVSSFSVDGRRFVSGQGDDPNGDIGDRGNAAETFRSFWISFALAMGIVIYLVVTASLVYKQRRHKFLPRAPGTISGVLAFIHQSRMLTDFVDTERMDSKTMRQHLEKLEKTYALGWFNGRDGEDHCGVDQEPVLAPYEFGVDWKKSRVLDLGQDWNTF